LLDTVGEILFYAIFLTPLLTIPLVWKCSKADKIYRILIGIGLAILISFVFFIISFAILFRDGLGPT